MLDSEIAEKAMLLISPRTIDQVLKKIVKDGVARVDSTPVVLEEELDRFYQFGSSKSSEIIVDLYDLTWYSFFDVSIIDYFDLYFKGMYCLKTMFPEYKVDMDLDVEGYLEGSSDGSMNPIFIWSSRAQDAIRTILTREPNLDHDELTDCLNQGVCLAKFVLEVLAAKKPKPFAKVWDLYKATFET